jgi:hypothetical protein
VGFHEQYSHEQREALAVAYAERRIRPARRVVALAAAGELEHNGAPLLPFEAKESTVRTLGSALLRRRAGLARHSSRRRRRAMPWRRCVGAW